ncbi:VanZ family protein [Candidatus Gottesmanbacteria bacterium]|nr:VanZ family protein [Candidatus Gottesmanbacteria bacterium]
MKFLRSWSPPIAWMIVIFLFSGRESMQVSDTQLINFLFFKTLHVIEYAILFILYVRAVGRRNITVAFLLTLLYAVTDEIHQLFVPTREGRTRDVIIDAIGATLAWISINNLLPRAPRKLRDWAKSWEII